MGMEDLSVERGFIPRKKQGLPGALVIGGDYQGLGIIRSLGRRNIPVYLLDSELCIGRVSKFTSKFIRCPANEELLINLLLTLGQKENLDGWVIYPTTDDMVKFLSIHRALLSQHYKISAPNWEITRFLYNKKLTYEVADKLNIPFPKTFYPDNIGAIPELPLRFPVIIKPAIRGIFYKKTKKKALLARDKKELIDKYKFTSTLIPSSEIMIQEIIPGRASNLYSFCSMFKQGVALAKLVAKRPRQHPMDFGRASTFVEIVDIPELEEFGSRLLSSINYYGLSEVEFMWDPKDRCYKLLEVNARTWGWHTIGNQIGIDFPFLLYEDLIIGEPHLFKTQNSKLKTQSAKWMRILTDTPVALKEILNGRLKLNEYLASLSGKKEYSVWSVKDPLPFFLEFLLLPYLSKTRGY